MTQQWVSFKAVKQGVSMEMALANYGVMLHRLDRCYLRGRCPLPTHQSRSSAPSFVVNTEKNAWACHSDSCASTRGGLGGNVLDFVAWMENCSVREAALRLQDWFALSAAPAVPRAAPSPAAIKADDSDPMDVNPPLPFVLHSIDFHHPYLAERGISAETAKHFGIGFFPRRGCMAGRIVIPIHNEEGLLVAYAGRTPGQAEPKYRFPSRFRKSLVLFNLHRAICCGDTVVVVEGFFDCLNVHQAGLPCVVALMGCALSRRQELLLESHFRNVVLLMDGDKAGRNAGAEIAGRLVAKLSTRLVEVPTGSQPDQLCADQIRCLCIPGYF
jgi:DNA primase